MDTINFISFPRTATTYCCEAFKYAIPTHNSQIIYHKINSLKKEKNVITILRQPDFAISSTLLLYKKENIVEHLDWYIEFMKVILDRFDKIFVTTFEQVINNVNDVIKIYCSIHKINNYKKINTKTLFQKVAEKFPDNIPTRQNMMLQEKIKKTKNYTEANDLYETARARSLLLNKDTLSWLEQYL